MINATTENIREETTKKLYNKKYEELNKKEQEETERIIKKLFKGRKGKIRLYDFVNQAIKEKIKLLSEEINTQ